MRINPKHIITLLFIILTTQVFSQEDSINRYDQDGKKDGVWKKYYHYPDQLRYEGQFEHGKEVGTFKFYKPNSKNQPVATKTYKTNNDTVYLKFFTPKKGYLITQGKIVDKKRVGQWTYYQKNDKKKVLMLEHYKNDKLDGLKKVFFPNGKLTEEIEYTDGRKNGKHKIYAENGKLIQQYHYVNDTLQGYSKVYDAKGNVVSEGSYKNGQRDGKWRFYTEGKLDSIQKYPLKKIVTNIPAKKKDE